jgi:brefeldin A-inhibited guanine nucleotide-exchange protein
MLAAVVDETLPDAAELVTPPKRALSVGDSLSSGAAAAAATPTAAAAAAGGSAQGLSQPRPPYTLREGVGMRRLLKFRVAAGVQLLLVQAASEMYAQQYMHLGVSTCACTSDMYIPVLTSCSTLQ